MLGQGGRREWKIREMRSVNSDWTPQISMRKRQTARERSFQIISEGISWEYSRYAIKKDEKGEDENNQCSLHLRASPILGLNHEFYWLEWTEIPRGTIQLIWTKMKDNCGRPRYKEKNTDKIWASSCLRHRVETIQIPPFHSLLPSFISFVHMTISWTFSIIKCIWAKKNEPMTLWEEEEGEQQRIGTELEKGKEIVSFETETFGQHIPPLGRLSITFLPI